VNAAARNVSAVRAAAPWVQHKELEDFLRKEVVQKQLYEQGSKDPDLLRRAIS
jgi:hypothetical protein